MDSFYLTLPSNVKSNVEQNTQSEYRIDLPQTLILDGEWECGLVEFVYPHSWNNIENKKEPGESFENEILVTLKNDTSPHILSRLDAGYYDNIGHMVEEINSKLKAGNKIRNIRIARILNMPLSQLETDSLIAHSGKQKMSNQKANRLKFNKTIKKNKVKRLSRKNSINQKPKLSENLADKHLIIPDDKVDTFIKFGYKDNIKRVLILINQRHVVSVKLSKKLQYVLGFGNDVINRAQWAKYPVDLKVGLNNLFVYSDIVQPTIIGDKMARLLRICPARGKFGETITKNFDRPHYLPVAYSTINSIEINIKDSLNNFIKFSFGTVIVKLHFRRKRFLPF